MVKNFVERLLAMPYLMETPGDEGAGGGGNGDGNPGAGNDGDHKPGDGDGKQKPVAGDPGAGGKKQPADDARYNGVVADLQKERKARQKYEADHKAAMAELDRERARVRALSGLEVKTPEAEQEALIRQRMEALYPWMKDLTAEDIAAIRETKGRFSELESATQRTWTTHANKMLSSVTNEAQKALGGGKLSERQQKRIQQAYVDEARSNPEFLKRHESGDETLIKEFVTEWVEDFVEPGRRSAQQSELQRRPRVPGGKDRSLVGAGERPIDVKDPKAVEDMLVAGFKARGGQFGRR